MMYSACKLNKQGDNIQPWLTPFPIWNQSVVPCPALTVASWPAYRFLRRQVRWSGIPTSWRIFQFVVIHTVKGFGLVNKADAFLELSCFLDNPTDVGNFISGSSAFSKSNLNIWKFTVHVLLKPGLENFEHYFASVWDECNHAIVCFLWRCLSLGLEWNRSSLSPSFCSLKCPDTTPNRVGRTPTYAPSRLCLCGEVAFPTTVWGFISSMAKKEVKTSLPSGSQHFIIFILTL